MTFVTAAAVPAIVGFTSFALLVLRRRQDSAALLSRAVESARASVICVKHDGAICSWNEGARALYGYEAGEIIGRPLSVLGPVVHLGTSEHTTRDGRNFRVASILSPVTDSCGRTIGQSIISRDVTRDTLVELELRQAREAAEAASAAKSAFLANMSHEIRTPMTAIIGYAELLLAQAGPTTTSDDVRQWAHIIHESGERLLSVINDILDLSKIEAGKLKVVRTTCRPMEVVVGVVTLLEPQAKLKGLTIEIARGGGDGGGGGDVPDEVHTDPDRLRQILLNLVGNAIKFTVRGGVTIRVTTQTPQDRRRQICFDVTDTGMGIPVDQRHVIFDHFGQAFAPAGCHGGSGLGLPIARKLAQLLGGDVALVRSGETGSHFRAHVETSPSAIRMPAPAPAPAREPAIDAPRALSAAGEVTVLLAEDSSAVQRMLRQMLESAGVRVITASHGGDTIDAAMAVHRAGRRFDAILMDMQMPHTDGFAAAMTLRARGYTGRIVALTANAMEGARERCLAAGCDDYLAKPVQRDVLLRAIHHAAPQRAAA
jgi:signal transduction histidine kinase/CheY-like chemotaxis protein